jgi:hypothetical protein
MQASCKGVEAVVNVPDIDLQLLEITGDVGARRSVTQRTTGREHMIEITGTKKTHVSYLDGITA